MVRDWSLRVEFEILFDFLILCNIYQSFWFANPHRLLVGRPGGHSRCGDLINPSPASRNTASSPEPVTTFPKPFTFHQPRTKKRHPIRISRIISKNPSHIQLTTLACTHELRPSIKDHGQTPGIRVCMLTWGSTRARRPYLRVWTDAYFYLTHWSIRRHGYWCCGRAADDAQPERAGEGEYLSLQQGEFTFIVSLVCGAGATDRGLGCRVITEDEGPIDAAMEEPEATEQSPVLPRQQSRT